MKIILELIQMGSNKEWFLIVNDEKKDWQERSWILGKKKEVDDLIKKLKSL